MPLLSPFEFREMFSSARSFAVVGNAPTILDHENGAKIDGCDVVVRFNRATTAGLESKVGGRTDILVVNANNNRSMAPPPSETVRPRCIVCFLSPRLRVEDIDGFLDWVGETPVFFSFGPDLIGLNAGHHTRPLTSGTYMLLTILRMFSLDLLFITGFTMFGAKGGESHKYYQDDRHGVGTFHDLDVEAAIFTELLADGSLHVEMTPEIRTLIGETRQNTCPSRPKNSLLKRMAASLSWRIVNLGLRLRRIAEAN